MREIKRILCPVDLSDISRHAFDHAILVAQWYKAKITALHVCNPLVIPAADFTLAGIAPPPVLTVDDITAAREQVLAWLPSERPFDVDVVVASGHPANVVLERARALPADLIVIGTHGTGGFEHLMLGSVTEKVLRKAPCAVLTVPPRSGTTSRLPFRRILCPVDFSESSLAALESAFSLAREGDAAITVLHVFDGGDEPLTDRPITGPEYRRHLEHDLTVELEALVPDSVARWCRPSTRTARGKAYREILNTAAEDSCDLIVMGVHGRSPLDLMLFGSTTNQVVRRATCPVLTLRH
jgi:nucleotide-binding universal stress UspA family protein